MISGESRPRLAAKARLRFDRHADGWLLLYPERGLALNASAARIVGLCTGELTVDAIVDRLAAESPDAARADLLRDVLAFLGTLAERRLVET